MLRSPMESGSGSMPPKPSDNTKNGGPEKLQKQLRVLIVDDEKFIHRMTVRMLRAKGIEKENVVCVERGHAALELLESDNKFDLILLDLDMPGIKGTDVVMALNEKGKQDLIDKIVIQSGTLARDMTAEVCKLIHGRALQKPYEVEDFFALIGYIQEHGVASWRPPVPLGIMPKGE